MIRRVRGGRSTLLCLSCLPDPFLISLLTQRGATRLESGDLGGERVVPP